MRELVKGDRVKITGPWYIGAEEVEDTIGRLAMVVDIDPGRNQGMIFQIQPTGMWGTLWWCRENLRALPRRA